MTGPEGIALISVTTAAVLMPGVARRLAVPVAVAEIACGILLGRSGLGLGGDVVRSLADLGFALFLFVAGMEIDVGEVERRGVRVLALPLFCTAATMGIGLFAAATLGWSPWLGLAAGATSVPLMLAVLRELDLARTPVAQRMLTIAGVGELASIAMVVVFEIGAQAGDGGVRAMVVPALRALVPVLATVLLAASLRALAWWHPRVFLRFIAAEDAQELGMRAGLGLMAVFVGLAAVGGIEPLLGAFVAGLLVSWVVPHRGALEQKLGSMAYGFFVPIFFIQVGMRVEIVPSRLASDFGLFAALLGVMAVARLPTAAVLAATGTRARDSMAAAVLLSAPLTLLIAIVDLGARAGAIPPATEATAVAVAMVASVVFPAIGRRLLRSGRSLGAEGAG